MKLEAKLNVSTGVLVMAMLASATYVHLRMLNVLHLAALVDGQRQPFILDLQTMRGYIADSVIALESSILQQAASPDRNAGHFDSDARRQVEAALNPLLSAGQNLVRGPGRDELSELERQVNTLLREEDEVQGFSWQGPAGANAAQAALMQRVLPLNQTLSEETQSFIRSQSTIKNEEELALIQADHAILLTVWSVTVLGGLLGGFLSFVLARRMSRALALVAARASAIASGDLTGSELGIDQADQIGSLAVAMQSMQGGLAAVIGTVASTSGSLTASAVAMRSASDQIHRRIDQQSQQTQQAATAMQEMSASIAEVSRHTHSAAETARAAAQTARDGGAIVKEVLGSMHSIALAVTETSSTVGLLGEDSRRISQIVTVIDEIARKTNLLALNAAIEAARAGEQGRGFAVVAGEVRRLAESTAQATGEIATMIQEIQDRTRIAIASMASGTGTVEQGVVTTTQAGEALERIIGMAERVDRMITQIAIAAQQQATAADKSSASLDSIHSLSHENLTEMATTAAGIENLRGTAVTLEQQVDRFHIHSNASFIEAHAA